MGQSTAAERALRVSSGTDMPLPCESWHGTAVHLENELQRQPDVRAFTSSHL